MRDIYQFYITPEEYNDAEKRGISNELLTNRVRKLGWDKQRAMTEESQAVRRVDRSEWIKIAEKNGISRRTFLTRVNKSKWTCEKAATYPIKYTAERNRKYSDEVYKTLEENGISKELFYDRIRKGWSMERAMTEKKFNDKEKAQKMLEKMKDTTNGFKELQRLHWAARKIIV